MAVEYAHRKNIKVVPLVGPSSILLALMASGMNGQSFTFHGYLPIDKKDRAKKIQEIEADSFRKNQTQIFIETPFRNNILFENLVSTCHNATKLCVACDITDENEFIQTKLVHEWKTQKIDLHKRPAIFLIHKT